MRALLSAFVLLTFLCGAFAGEPISHHLVSLGCQPDPPVLGIRYATRMNFKGEKLYPAPVAWLHQDAAAALAMVQFRFALM